MLPTWFWKVRIYNSEQMYGCGQFATERDLQIIDSIQEFYMTLTGHKMVLEGMSESPFPNVPYLDGIFNILWKAK